MSRTDAVTRILFEAFPTAEVRLFYALGYTAIGIFCWGVYVQIRKYRRGAALALDGSIWSRAADMVGKVLSHRTVDRRDQAAGGAHRLIFYGFALLFLGTATITLQYDILEPLFGIRFWQGRFYLIFSLVLDIAGIALLGGLLYMMYRRGWMRLPKLDYARPDRALGDPDFLRPGYRREDWAFLWTLVIIGFTGYVLEAARLVWLHAEPEVWDTRWWSPVGAAVAQALESAGLTAHGGGVLRLSLWWFHGLLALTFIALIPFTKVKHIFTAAGFPDGARPAGGAAPAAHTGGQETPGVAKITDFTWKQLLNLDACTKCGRCHEACPARAVGAPLSPRDVILSLREFANATLRIRARSREAAELDVHGKSPGQVAMETLWSCRTCMACVEICPVAVEHVPIIVQMRRKLVEDGAMDPLLRRRCRRSTRPATPSANRSASAAPGPRPCRSRSRTRARSRSTCCGSSATTPRSIRAISRSRRLSRRSLHEAGVDFGILYDGESNAGNDVRRVGEEGLYEMLANSNIAALAGATFKSIVTTDPALLQHDPQRIPRLRRQDTRSSTTPASLKTAVRGREGSKVTRPLELPRRLFTTPAISAASTRATRRRASCCGCSAANSSKWVAAATIRSVAAPAAAGSGFPTRSAARSRPRTASARPPRSRASRFMS